MFSRARLGGEDQSPRITASSLHHFVWGAAETQWMLGQRHEAVLPAAKAVNSQLQAKVNRRDASGIASHGLVDFGSGVVHAW